MRLAFLCLLIIYSVEVTWFAAGHVLNQASAGHALQRLDSDGIVAERYFEGNEVIAARSWSTVGTHKVILCS
jgi:hypothetical protein